MLEFMVTQPIFTIFTFLLDFLVKGLLKLLATRSYVKTLARMIRCVAYNSSSGAVLLVLLHACSSVAVSKLNNKYFTSQIF